MGSSALGARATPAWLAAPDRSSPLGDVIEFGADTPARPVRWFGIMDSYELDRWATIQGPYPTPTDAWHDAERLLALERFLPPLPTEPPRARRRATGPAANDDTATTDARRRAIRTRHRPCEPAAGDRE